MDVRIVGVELPPRDWCDPRKAGAVYENVHVGIQCRKEAVEWIVGGSREAAWDFTIDTVVADDGELDFRGPFVHGKRGDRFLYLSWGTVGEANTFTMFRRAKLMLSAVDGAVLRAAGRSGHRLLGSLGLTDRDGGPRCAAVRPPAITWIADRAK